MEKLGDGKSRAVKYGWNTIFRDRELGGGVEIPDVVTPKYKNGVSDWIGVQKGDTTPILYVSSIAGSADWNDRKFTRMTGIRNRCFSYAYAGSTSPLYHKKHGMYLRKALRHDLRIFMDSGAHTLHRILRSGKTLAKRVRVPAELRRPFIEYLTDEWMRRYSEYIKWCYAMNMHFDFYVTLDAQKDCAIIYELTKQLKKQIGIAPVPVYHGDSGLDWVRRYIDDGHKIICAGVSNKYKGKEARHRYYSCLFELTEKKGMKVHGLALTGDKLFQYPWYSIDSATHIKCASFGKILVIIPEKQRVAQVHISKKFSEFTAYGNMQGLHKGAVESMKEIVESRGFDYEELSNNLSLRILYNARVLQDAVIANTKQKDDFRTWKALV